MVKNTSQTIAERIAQTHIKELDVNADASAVIANIFRVAVMFRNRAEREVLARYRLSFSGFTVLWVLWVWGKKQSHELASESGIAKGTLTGIVQTLRKYDWVETSAHETDSRRKYVALTAKGAETISKVFQEINQLEQLFVENLEIDEQHDVSRHLRIILNTMDEAQSNLAEQVTHPREPQRRMQER